MTMDVEMNPSIGECSGSVEQDMSVDDKLGSILKVLSSNDEICFVSQQRGDNDLSKEEKCNVAAEIFQKSKLNFLTRFGRFMNGSQLESFTEFINPNEQDSAEIQLFLKDLIKINNRNVCVKNRRYEALKKLVAENEYFSEIEMMKRNPLLYDQLVGRYLTDDEIRERDRYKMDENATFVKILMEGIERDNAEVRRKEEENFEDNAKEEEDSDSDQDDTMSQKSECSQVGTSRWGEFEADKMFKPKSRPRVPNISLEEKRMLREEFITSMYQSFLNGTDKEFDYNVVDNDVTYDSLAIMEHDDEDKYFDSEEPATAVGDFHENESSEDELDIYMSALDQNPTVRQLREDIERL